MKCTTLPKSRVSVIMLSIVKLASKCQNAECFLAECRGIKLCHCADYSMYAMCRYDVCFYCKCRGAIFSLFFPFSLSKHLRQLSDAEKLFSVPNLSTDEKS
jgi:hypothetical protein